MIEGGKLDAAHAHVMEDKWYSGQTGVFDVPNHGQIRVRNIVVQ